MLYLCLDVWINVFVSNLVKSYVRKRNLWYGLVRWDAYTGNTSSWMRADCHGNSYPKQQHRRPEFFTWLLKLIQHSSVWALTQRLWVTNIWILNSVQGYTFGGSDVTVCSCGVPNALDRYNMHTLVWMFIIPFFIIIFSYGNIASVIYNSTKRTKSHRERISSEAERSGHSRFQKLGSSSKIDPRTKRLLLLIIALVVR